MSATVRSKYDCSRCSTNRPRGVLNQSPRVPVDSVPAAAEDPDMASIIPIPAFADNYIWLIREAGNAAVVDPGDAAPVQQYLEREQLTLTAILCTHHHGDHVGGNQALVKRWQSP